MPSVAYEHFLRAAADIALRGDNDTLPFDMDTRFVSDCQKEIAQLAFNFYEELQRDSEKNSASKLSELSVFNERLLSPSGPFGFRVVTKIHPFWNLYFNGLGIGIADALEDKRSDRACSYRFSRDGSAYLFDRNHSWREFKIASARQALSIGEDATVVQTDISSFYEHISHHHVQNFIDDLFHGDKRIGNQINALLNKFSSGRSFGLPVGGQCARILAELFLNGVDHRVTADGVKWLRFVDDYVLIADSQSQAYSCLATLSNTLADYGVGLSKTKTIVLPARHYSDYFAKQISSSEEESSKLREIDLHFDPYSDTAQEDYDSLCSTIAALDVQKLLNRELLKTLPDNFLGAQIGRTLPLHEPGLAIQLASTLLNPQNLHSFRASWSTIMRGIAHLRGRPEFERIFAPLDELLDDLPNHSAHLLHAEASLLHYLRTLRFSPTPRRVAFVRRTYTSTLSDTVKRACIDCWRHWKDRDGFTFCRTRWDQVGTECQRLTWLASFSFGDQGEGFRRLIKRNLERTLALGIERQSAGTYASLYGKWCEDVSRT